MGWLSYLTLVSFTAATAIQGLAILNFANYTPEPWQGTLLTWAVVLFGFFFNTVLAPRLPAVEVLIFALHVVGWFSFFIVLLVLAPRNDPYVTFTQFSDNAGWGSIGVSSCAPALSFWQLLLTSSAVGCSHYDEQQCRPLCGLRISSTHVYVAPCVRMADHR